jgi:hypothetical protein
MTRKQLPRQPPRRRFLQAESRFDIVQAMDTLFMRSFEGESCWDAWRVILKAAFALPMTTDEVAFFRTIAGDRDPPKMRVKGCGLWRPTWRQRQHRLSDCHLCGGVLSRRA